MKSLFIFILFFSCFFSLHAQIVNIPDANFKTKLLALGIDSNNDGNIQTSEALSINALDISYSGIGNILGLEAFVNLDTLICTGNIIPTLSLTTLTNLIFLDCSLNKISSLDLTTVPNLKTLSCGTNLLTNLDVNNVLNLKYLECGENQLSSLNVNALHSITFLYCNDNPNLTELYMKNGSNEYNLNFANNPNLNYICADANQLQTIQQKANSYGLNNVVINDLCTTDISTQAMVTFRLFPNPTHEQITISTNERKTLALMNSLGECIATIHILAQEVINISTLPKGIYWLKDVEGASAVSFIIE